MPLLPEALTALVAALRKLPGIGPRSAERIALHIVQDKASAARNLAEAILKARDEVRACVICGALTSGEACAICSDPRRDGSAVCLVEKPVDILSLENSGTFKGNYHVLGGKLSPLNGVQPEDLNLESLGRRVADTAISELVLALGTDVEGDATGQYIAKRFAREGLKITRLAYGLPAGTGLEYADHLTLSRALEGRREIQ